jgi:hypothetical protein
LPPNSMAEFQAARWCTNNSESSFDRRRRQGWGGGRREREVAKYLAMVRLYARVWHAHILTKHLLLIHRHCTTCEFRHDATRTLHGQACRRDGYVHGVGDAHRHALPAPRACLLPNRSASRTSPNPRRTRQTQRTTGTRTTPPASSSSIPAHPIPALIRTPPGSTSSRAQGPPSARPRLSTLGATAACRRGASTCGGVRLPDEYDQIERDLGPFYGVRGGESRAVQHGREAHMDSCTLGKDMGDGRDVYGEAYADEESESLGIDTVLGGHSGSSREAGCATG